MVADKQIEDPWELAATRLIGELINDEALELVTSHGLLILSHGLTTQLQLIEAAPDRASRLAEWFVDHNEVRDLWADDDQLEALLRTHWDVVAVDLRQAQASPAAHNPELEAILMDADDDDPAWLVYSDWLLSRGDPIGELAALRLAQRETSGLDSRRAKRRADAFFRAHKDALIGVVGQYPRIVRLDWQLAWVRGAELRTSPSGNKEYSGAVLLAALLERPLARFLRRLWLGPFDHRGNDQYAEMSQALLASRQLGLRELEIGVGETRTRVDQTALGDLRGLDECAPELRRLRLRGAYVELGPLKLAELRALDLDLLNPSTDNAAALAASELPQLGELSFVASGYTLPDRAYRGALTELLDRRRTPALDRVTLRIREPECVVAPLLESGCLERVSELGLADCELQDRHVLALAARLAHADRRLERFDLSGNRLSATAFAAAREVSDRVLGDDREAPA